MEHPPEKSRTSAKLWRPNCQVRNVAPVQPEGTEQEPGMVDSFNRHEQLLRLFHVIDILTAARRELTTAEVRERLISRGVVDEVSEKSVHRDIEFLTRVGYSINRTQKPVDRGRPPTAWRLTSPAKTSTAPPTVTLAELLSLMAARDLFAPLAGTVYWRGIAHVIAKIEAVATPALLAHAEGLTDGLVVHPPAAATKYPSDLLNSLHHAIRHSLELEIHYHRLGTDEPASSLVHPEALVLYGGSLYLAAHRPPADHSEVAHSGIPDRSAPPSSSSIGGGGGGESPPPPSSAAERPAPQIRFFKLARFASAKVMPRRFTRQGVRVEDLLADSITIYRSPEPPRRYRIRVAAERARWACEKPFHPQQQVTPEPDGSITLDIPRAWDNELIPQLLALGHHAEVLSPADTRDRLAEEARRILAGPRSASKASTMSWSVEKLRAGASRGSSKFRNRHRSRSSP